MINIFIEQERETHSTEYIESEYHTKVTLIKSVFHTSKS